MQWLRSRGLRGLQRLDVRRLLALRTRLHFEGNALVFLERLETFAANFREVREQVVTARVRCDKAKALSIVEPFYDTSFHIPVSLKILIKTGHALKPITIRPYTGT
jgi:hypothetical protein